ncbi:MAG TPA: hypothetical protein VEX62_12515 [Candidatus Limnocylindrales bacterium]|nr:hypothetical protein [Candidatus Limnocylindrales bacterium]
MSASPGEDQTPRPVSRAAELAAQQVESIVAAAQASAEQLAANASQQLEAARQEAESVRALARESAQADVEAGRKEARERLREAQDAADQILAEAKAVSGGMRQLANLLTVHAERILRDVTNSYNAMSADLRAAGREDRPPAARADAAEAADAPDAPDAPARERGRARPRRPNAEPPDNPFADLEPPSWVEN